MSAETSEIDKTFKDGNNALYMVIQVICPECNKLIRVSLLTNDKGVRRVGFERRYREHNAKTVR